MLARRKRIATTAANQPVSPRPRFFSVAQSFFADSEIWNSNGLSITHLEMAYFERLFRMLQCDRGFTIIKLENNDIPYADLVGSFLPAQTFQTTSGFSDLHLHHGRNGKLAPWEEGLWHYVTLSTTLVDFNCGQGEGELTHEDEGTADFSEAGLNVAQLTQLLEYLSAQWPDLAWELNIAGSCASLAGQPQHVFELIDNLTAGGWEIVRHQSATH